MVESDIQQEVLFVKLLPGLADEAVKVEYTLSALSDEPSFIACAIFTEEPRDRRRANPEALEPEFNLLFLSLRHLKEPISLWIEQLCTGFSTNIESRLGATPKAIYEAADRVIVWAGNDSEPIDKLCFDEFLDAGTSQTTGHAFEFACNLSGARVPEVPGILQRCFSTTEIQSWAYLFRILCRPFFQRLPLLRTNYAANLPKITVRCSESELDLSVLAEASLRIWAIFPVPHFLRKGEAIEGRERLILEADRQFLQSCLQFGWESPLVMGRMQEGIRDLTQDRHEPGSRYFAHIGSCLDVYDISSRPQLIKSGLNDAEAFEADRETYMVKALDQRRSEKPPSLKFEGQLPPSIQAIDQAPFVHFRTNRVTKILLVQVLPASTLHLPLQCGLIESPMESPPEFRFVSNSLVLRSLLPSTQAHGVTYRSTTRQTSSILVNGQQFVVPRLQELFLRLARDAKESSYFFIYNMCMYSSELLETRKDVEEYCSVKYFMKKQCKAVELDMYSMLEEAGRQRSAGELQLLGLPADTAWDDWLVDLND